MEEEDEPEAEDGCRRTLLFRFEVSYSSSSSSSSCSSSSRRHGAVASVRTSGDGVWSWCFDDLEAVVGPWLDGVMLPKVERVSDLHSVDWAMANLERRLGLEVGRIDLLPIIETARGMGAIRDIAASGTRVKRFSFGAGDYTRDLGLTWTLTEGELAAARAELVLASRMAELEAPVDTVFIHIREHDALEASTRLGREFGFQGKLCIHPDQVALANRIYTPDDAEVAWAEKIVASFAQAEADGLASIQVDGYFVDYPIVEKAQRLIDTAQAVRAQNV